MISFLYVLMLMSIGMLSHSLQAIQGHLDMTLDELVALGELPQFNATVDIDGCSGVMLSSEWAMYAGHCVGNADGARRTVRYRENGVVVASSAGTVYIFDSGTPRTSGEDAVALVLLDTPLTATGTYLAPYDQFDEVGRIGWQTGQGQYRLKGGALQSPDGFFRAGTQLLKRVDSDYLYFSDGGSPEVANPNPDTTRFEALTAPGDSGGSVFLYSRGRFFSASTVYGAIAGRGWINNRVSVHRAEIEDRTGSEFGSALNFAYPQQVVPVAHWVAEDLGLGNGAVVTEWTDRIAGLSFANSSDGGAGSPTAAVAATPTGLSSVAFAADDALGLSAVENPLADQTAMSVVMVVKLPSAGSGFENQAFKTMGILDASSGADAWGLSYSRDERVGWSVEAQDDSTAAIFRGGAGNGALSDGQWHVIVATWDGSEIVMDNAGDDRNMKLYVDTVDQVSTLQGPSHINVGRSAVSLLLGDSQTNNATGFSGEIAELRLYQGELQMHEVDRMLTSLRAQYVSGTPGVVFQRPWVDHLEVPLGSQLRLRGELTGGATSAVWTVESGTGAVTFSDVNSPNTDVLFDTAGPYHLRITANNGGASGAKDVFVDVTSDSFSSTDTTARALGGNWISSEIGDSATGGGFTESGGQFSVTGSGIGLGVDVGETYDHGHFVWKGAAGDFDWSARLNSVSNQDGPTRAGIMLRGGPGPTDAAAFIGMAPDGKLYALFRTRGGIWGDLTVDETPTGFSALYYKLERRGNTVTAYTSSDGVTYTQFASSELALPGLVRTGFFVTSGNAGNTVTASFDATALEQIGYAPATTIEAVGQGSTGIVEYGSSSLGADEPWVTLEQESGPTAVAPYKAPRNFDQVYRADAPIGGDYSFRFIADDGNTISFSSESALASQNRYDFNIDGLDSGWSTPNVGSATVASSLFSGIATSGDPQLRLSGLSIDGSEVKRVAIRLQVSVDGPVTLFWSNTFAPGFTSERSLTLPYTGNGGFQTLVFEVGELDSWNGKTITDLRIDPIGGVNANGASFGIDAVDFLGSVITESTLLNQAESAGQSSFDFGVATLSAYRGATVLMPNAVINSANLAYIGVNSSGVGSDPNLNAINDNDGVPGGADQERLRIELEPNSSLSQIVWNWSAASGSNPEDGVRISGFKADPEASFSGGVSDVSAATYTQADGSRLGTLRFQISDFNSTQRIITFNNPEATAGATLEITVAGGANAQFAILSMGFISENTLLTTELANSGAVVLAGGADNLSGSNVVDISWQVLQPIFDVSPLTAIVAGDSGEAGGFIQPAGGAAAFGNADSVLVGRDHALDSDPASSQRGIRFDFILDEAVDLSELLVETGHVDANGADAGGSSDLVFRISGGTLGTPLSGQLTVDYSSGAALQGIVFDLGGESIGAGSYTVEIYQTNFVGSSAFAAFNQVALGVVTDAASTPSVGNSSFEVDTFTVNNGYISENFPITGWEASATDRAGLNPSNRSPFANNGTIPDGSNVAFLQANGSPSSLKSLFGMAGLVPGQSYELRFRVNCRSGFTDPDMRLLVDNIEVLGATVTAVGGTNPYETVSYTFVANSNMMPLEIQNATSSGDATLLLDDFVVRAIPKATISVSEWTGNSDSGITDTQAYTHAYNLGSSPINTTINGVDFTGVHGRNPSVAGSFTYTMSSNLTDSSNNLSEAGSADLAQSFVYENGNATLTLEGLEPGKTYRTSLFSVGFGSAPRTVTFFLNDESLSVDHNAFGDNNGLRVDFEYVATDTTQTIQLDSLGAPTFHTYAFTNNLVYSYDLWQAEYPGMDVSNPEGDADGDGIANSLEAWLGTNPGEPSPLSLGLTVNGVNASFTHPFNPDLAADLSGSYEWSPNLSQWYAGDGVAGPEGGPRVTITADTVADSTTVNAVASDLVESLFFRIVLTQEP